MVEGLVKRLKAFSGVGIALGLASGLLFSFGGLLAKMLNSDAQLHAMTLTLYRQTFLIFFAGPQVAYHKASYLGAKKDWPFLATRSITGALGVALNYLAFAYLPIADVGVILAASPTLTTLLGHLLLKERCFISDSFILCLTLLGIIFILRPVFLFKLIAPHLTDEISPENRLIGSSLALGAALSNCGIFLSYRKLRKVNYATISFTYAWTSAPCVLIIVLVLGVFQMPSCYLHRTMAVGMGAMAVSAQAASTLSGKFLPAGINSLICSTETVFNFFWQMLFFGGSIDPFSVIGCLLVAFAISFLALRTYVVQEFGHKESSTIDNKFIIFLLTKIFK